MNSAWMLTKDAAKYLGVKPSKLHRLAAEGKIRRYKESNRLCWFDPEDLDRYVKSLAEQPGVDNAKDV